MEDILNEVIKSVIKNNPEQDVRKNNEEIKGDNNEQNKEEKKIKDENFKDSLEVSIFLESI